jgi:hypothetical protein
MLQTPVYQTLASRRPAELAAKQLFQIFPTPMFTGMLPDIGMCDRIEKSFVNCKGKAI